MTKKRRTSRSRWALALLTGFASAAVIAAALHFGTGLDLELSVLFGGAIGLVLAFLERRWFAAAGAVLTAVEIAASALAVVATLIAAIASALS